MKIIEANNTFLFTLLHYLLSPYKSNLIKGISSRLRTFESGLQSLFMRLVLGVMTFWSAEKNGKSILFLDYKRAADYYYPESYVQVYVPLDDSSLHVVFIPYMRAALNTLFKIILINLSKGFLNILYELKLLISKLNLFHSLIIKEKELAKYLDLQKICLVLLLFQVR